MSIFTVAFWRAASERAIKSAAQGTVLTLVGIANFDALHADWETIGGGALGMAILSLLTSIGSNALTQGSGPSLTDAEMLSPDSAAFASALDAANANTAKANVVLEQANAGLRDATKKVADQAQRVKRNAR